MRADAEDGWHTDDHWDEDSEDEENPFYLAHVITSRNPVDNIVDSDKDLHGIQKSRDRRYEVISEAHLQFVNDAEYPGEVANNLNVADEANPIQGPAAVADAHSDLGCAQVDYDVPECEQEMEASDTFEEEMQIEFGDYVASLEDSLSSRGAWNDKDGEENKDFECETSFREEVGGHRVENWLECGKEDWEVKGDQKGFMREENLRDGQNQREDPTHLIAGVEDEVEEEESGQDTSECEFEEDEERDGERSPDEGSPLTWRKLRWTKEESPMVPLRNEGSPLRLLNRPLKGGQVKSDGENIEQQDLHTKPESKLLYNCNTCLFYEAPRVQTNVDDEDRCETNEDINSECKVSHEEKDHENKVQEKVDNEEISENIPFAEEVVKYIFDHILDDIFDRNLDITTEDEELRNEKCGEIKLENEESMLPLHDSLGRVLSADWWEEFLQSRSVSKRKSSLTFLVSFLKEWG